MSSTSSTMERSVSRVGCDGGGAKVGGVPAAVSALEDEEEVVISQMEKINNAYLKSPSSESV